MPRCDDDRGYRRCRCDTCTAAKLHSRTKADMSAREQMRERAALPDDGRNCAACYGLGWVEGRLPSYFGENDGPACGWCGGTGRAEG